MSESRNFDINIEPVKSFDENIVMESEMRLLSAFFPDILKEMMMQIELNKE